VFVLDYRTVCDNRSIDMKSYRVTIVYYVQRDYLKATWVSSRKLRTAVNSFTETNYCRIGNTKA
jgi:hypothetical protein